MAGTKPSPWGISHSGQWNRGSSACNAFFLLPPTLAPPLGVIYWRRASVPQLGETRRDLHNTKRQRRAALILMRINDGADNESQCYNPPAPPNSHPPPRLIASNSTPPVRGARGTLALMAAAAPLFLRPIRLMPSESGVALHAN